MRKIIALPLIIMVCLVLASCGKKTTDENITQDATMSWQEQYDMGIRLLAEGNYEEAILVFQAMIQIDPRQSEVYQKLAEAYIAVGDYEKAASVLAEGFKTTGVASLEQQLKDVQAQIDALAAQTGSPAEEPELPRILQYDPNNPYPASVLEYGEEEYGVFTDALFAMLKPVIEAGQNGDQAACMAALETIDVAPLEEVSYAWHGENGHFDLRGWTVWNGDLLGYSHYSSPDYELWNIEYRPADGIGFYLMSSHRGENDVFTVLWGQTLGWLRNGELHRLEEHCTAGEVTMTIRATGFVKDELLHGEYSCWQQEAFYGTITNYFVLEHGYLQTAFTDPITGEACIMKRVIEDGSGEEIYFDGHDEIMSYMCTALLGVPMG